MNSQENSRDSDADIERLAQSIGRRTDLERRNPALSKRLRAPRRRSPALAAVLVFTCCLLTAFNIGEIGRGPLASVSHEELQDRAQHLCEFVVAAIERYAEEHGDLPMTLDGLGMWAPGEVEYMVVGDGQYRVLVRQGVVEVSVTNRVSQHMIEEARSP